MSESGSVSNKSISKSRKPVVKEDKNKTIEVKELFQSNSLKFRQKENSSKAKHWTYFYEILDSSKNIIPHYYCCKFKNADGKHCDEILFCDISNCTNTLSRHTSSHLNSEIIHLSNKDRLPVVHATMYAILSSTLQEY